MYEKLRRLKSTKSTLPIDLPNKLRKEVEVELTKPLTVIINWCLSEGRFPTQWKHEWISPVPKVPEPQVLKNLRKVACTSDFNKVLESFTKDWILEDVGKKLDLSQFGGKKGLGSEHMVVAMVDRVLKLLDNNTTRSAVLKVGVDWDSAFERGDPTITVKKFLAMGLRPSLAPLVAYYLTRRHCTVKFNSAESNFTQLTGGFPQGSLIGQDAYLVTSDDCADHINEEDKYRYIDNMEILELVRMTGILIDYDCQAHVPSDIGTHQQFLPPDKCDMQSRLDQISRWTTSNIMKLNSSKSNYMVFSRSQEEFVTRLAIDGQTIDQKEACKILGVWISQDAGDWERNTKEICKSAYARISMLTKLRYVGVRMEDLLEIYVLFIRSRTEYCSVAFHSSLTQEQSRKLENIQRTCLKIILQENYLNYESACEVTGLPQLSLRRETRCLSFARRCLRTDEMAKFFPLTPDLPNIEIRSREK